MLKKLFKFLRFLKWRIFGEKPWHMCPKCCKAITDGEECDNPNCDDGWMT